MPHQQMNSKSKLFFHASPPVYSGHESMLSLIIKTLAETQLYDIYLITAPECVRLINELSSYAHIIFCYGLNRSIEMLSLLSISGLGRPSVLGVCVNIGRTDIF